MTGTHPDYPCATTRSNGALRLHRVAGARAAPLAVVLSLLGGCTNGNLVPLAPTAPDAEDATALRASISESMAGNVVLRYADTWDVLADGAEVAPGAIRLFYTRRIVSAGARASGDDQAEGDYWNREHVWPQSYGLADTDARTDVHNLVPVDRTVNSSRGNKVFDEAGTPHHECTVCRVSGEAWEPAPEVQGDVARIAFYMDVRYEGRPGADAGDLDLSDDPDPEARRFGVLSTLLDWHCADPVSAEELRRHQAAAGAQGNRNAFVDVPELVGQVYGVECPPMP